MKLQLHAQHVRLRLDEAELAVLLEGGEAANRTCFPGTTFVQSLALADVQDAILDVASGNLRVQLPRSAIEAYCAQLPCRDGLEFLIAGEKDTGALRLVFEVDVRDSVRRRGPATRSARAA